MTQTNEVRFERKAGDWVLSLSLMLAALILFVLTFPQYGFNTGNKMTLYWFFFLTVLFLFAFYRACLRPYALRFTPDGALLVKSVFFSKLVAVSAIESVLITETPDPKTPKVVYTLQVKGGDPLEIPSLGPMDIFMEKLAALNPQMNIEDKRSRMKS